jgi:predicted RNA-binding protein YlxR (DUF448 family)
MTPKHVPLRTCVQCRQVRPKRELIRIVRTLEGTIEIDERGKAAGRGAYLCRNRACWEGAIRHERLEHALKTTFSAADKQRLLQYGQQMPDMAIVSPEVAKTQVTVPEKGDKAAAKVLG